jgi:predicted nucleotidyltransferase
MQPAVRDHLPAIVELCKAYDVRALYLYGSAARGDFDPNTSDLDFLVQFADTDLGPWMRRLFELQRALEQLLRRKVDLHLASAVPASSLSGPIESGKIALYAAA